MLDVSGAPWAFGLFGSLVVSRLPAKAPETRVNAKEMTQSFMLTTVRIVAANYKKLKMYDCTTFGKKKECGSPRRPI